VPHSDSQRFANSSVNGAVALTMRSSTGIACADQPTPAVYWRGVISTRRPLRCDKHRNHFIGVAADALLQTRRDREAPVKWSIRTRTCAAVTLCLPVSLRPMGSPRRIVQMQRDDLGARAVDESTPYFWLRLWFAGAARVNAMRPRCHERWRRRPCLRTGIVLPLRCGYRGAVQTISPASSPRYSVSG
jgi:hypothetical protein